MTFLLQQTLIYTVPLLIVALALNMLGLTKIKVMNLVPAIFLPILLCTFM